MPSHHPTPRIIPVIDIMGGRVVRAVGGIREKCQPIACPFSGSQRPFDVACALLRMAGASELYIADLDSIMGGRGRTGVAPAVIGVLERCAVPTWLDAGIGRTLTIDDLPTLPHVRPVVGFETCSTPESLAAALERAGERRVAFSIDLKRGELIGHWRNWDLAGNRDALALARRVVGMGIRTLIVLDLARVGTRTGAGTEPLLKSLRNELAEVELIAGGGVKTRADIERLGEAGADAVLVATAIHDGTLTQAEDGS